MSTRRGITTGLVLAAVLAGPGLAADDPATYLTENEGRKVLKEPLTVREGQVGIAGLTGTVWTVEPSGEWKYSRFRRNRDGSEHLTPIRGGTLSAAELEDLAKSLARREFSTLPEKAGREVKVNPHNVTIKFGKKAATLEGLPPRRGGSVAEHVRKSAPQNEAADSGVWNRFAHILEAVESRCRAPEKAP